MVSWVPQILFRKSGALCTDPGVRSPASSSVSDLMLRSLIHLNLFLYRVRDRDLVLLSYVWISSFPRTIYMRVCLFFSTGSCLFSQSDAASSVCFWVLCSILLIYTELPLLRGGLDLYLGDFCLCLPLSLPRCPTTLPLVQIILSLMTFLVLSTT